MFSSFQKMGGVNPLKTLVSQFLSLSVSFLTLSFLVSQFLSLSVSVANAATFGDPDMRGRQMHNVGDPTAPQDVATKAYVDSKVNLHGISNNTDNAIEIDVGHGNVHKESLVVKSGGNQLKLVDIGDGDAVYIGRNDDRTDFIDTKNNLKIMTLKEDGNVGIGTTDPKAKLDINGEVKTNGVAFSSNGDVWDMHEIVAYNWCGGVGGWTNNTHAVEVTTSGLKTCNSWCNDAAKSVGASSGSCLKGSTRIEPAHKSRWGSFYWSRSCGSTANSNGRTFCCCKW